MFLGLPILAINPIPGQEEENAEVLEEMGVSVWVREKDNFEEKVKNMLNKENLENLKENAKKIGKPCAAEEICKIIFEEN